MLVILTINWFLISLQMLPIHIRTQYDQILKCDYMFSILKDSYFDLHYQTKTDIVHLQKAILSLLKV